MAPYKLEDNIREKLEARELKPSSDAWEKLEAKLDAAKPKKKPVLWYYMAASFVGFLILASIFFNRNTSEVSNQIVNETVEQQNSEKQLEVIPNNSKDEEIVSQESISEKVETIKPKEKDKLKTNSNTLKPLPQKKSEVDKKIQKSEMVANVSENEKENEIEKEKLILSEEEKHFNTKVEEVVASVKKFRKTTQKSPLPK